MSFLVFHPKGKGFFGPVLEKVFKSYAGHIGRGNSIIKNWFTATDRRFYKLKGFLSYFESFLSPIIDKMYHAKEVEFRRKMIYADQFSRDPDVSNNSIEFMIDVFSLSTLLHIPTETGTFEYTVPSKNRAANIAVSRNIGGNNYNSAQQNQINTSNPEYQRQQSQPIKQKPVNPTPGTGYNHGNNVSGGFKIPNSHQKDIQPSNNFKYPNSHQGATSVVHPNPEVQINQNQPQQQQSSTKVDFARLKEMKERSNRVNR